MEMFDPNQPLPQPWQLDKAPSQFDFEARQSAIEQRKKLLAALMRSQEQPMQQPQGQMVGRTYVKPHWTQQLAPLVEKVMNNYALTREQKGLADDQAAYARDDQAAAQAHQGRMPQARPELPGPQAEGGSPELAARTPTTQERLQWAQEGMAIPSRRETLSKLIDDLTINEPVREEQRQFRSSESAANRAQQARIERERLEQRAAEAEQRAEDAAATREQRAQAQREANDLRREIAAMNNETRRMVIEAAANKASAPKPVPHGLMKELGEAQDRATTIADLSRTFRPEYSGVTMGARVRAGAITGTDADAVDWWKNYRKQSELTERHALFGASLTEGEQKAWRDADIGPTTDPNVIARNLATRARLAGKVYATQRDRAIRSGYSGVADAFDAPAEPTRPASDGGASGSWDAAPVKVNTPAEAAKLKPGTRFVTPDGQERVRR